MKVSRWGGGDHEGEPAGGGGEIASEQQDRRDNGVPGPAPYGRWLVMQVHDSLIELVGNTPLVRLRRVTQDLGDGAPDVLAKVEYFNPGGSVKDRIALRMVAAAEASGDLRPGGTIIEPTSGNTGVGLAIVAAEKGYRCVFVCPDKVGQDKISVLRAYGAEVVVCPGAVPPDHPESYYSVSTRLARETPGGWKPDQYANPNNPDSHYHSTGPLPQSLCPGPAAPFHTTPSS